MKIRRESNLFLVATVSLLLACGGESSASPDAATDGGVGGDGGVAQSLCESRAGTRLTREVIVPSPGARQELSIIDSASNGECSYVLEEDGRYTCYPLNVGGSLFFQDPECSAAIVAFGNGQAPTQFQQSIFLEANLCFNRRELRNIGAPSAVVGGQTIFRLTNGNCTPVAAPPFDYYVAGPALGSDAFVRADPQLVSANSRLSGQTLVGSDGSSMCMSSTRAVDSSLNTTCDLHLAADLRTRCLPSSPRMTSIFADAMCASLVNAVSISSCSSPGYAFEPEPATCGATMRHIREVDLAMPLQAYSNEIEACIADSLASYVAVLDATDPSLFSAVEASVQASGSRLQRELLVSEDGFAAAGAGWFDTNLEHACSFQPAADGQLRCLPKAMTLRTYYSDPQCGAPISLGMLDECQIPGFFATQSPLGKRMFAADAHDEPVFTLSEELMGCSPVDGSFFKPAFEMAASSFVPAEVTRLSMAP